MSTETHPSTTGARFRAPAWLILACALAIAVGAAGLAISFVFAPLDAWLWLLVGFLTFGGAATGMVAWAAVFRVAQARWAGAVNRLGHSGIAFVPVAIVALIALVAGIRGYAPWVDHAPHGKGAWLNVPFFAIREAVGLGALWLLGLALVRRTLKADAEVAAGRSISTRFHYRLNAVAVALVIVYAVVLSIVSWDFIMSLSPEWVSTMFSAYFFTTNLYLAVAVLIVLAAAVRGRAGAEKHLGPQQFHDMGNLLLAFALLDMGFFFAQYLTIWYGNLPEETFFLIARYLRGPWPPIGRASLIVGYALPFLLLQSRRLKRTPRMLAPVAVIAIVGVTLERYVLVVPSLLPTDLMLYPVGILSLLGFAGAFVLAITLFLARYSPISAADEALRAIRGVGGAE